MATATLSDIDRHLTAKIDELKDCLELKNSGKYAARDSVITDCLKHHCNII